MSTAIHEALLRFLRLWTDEALTTVFNRLTGLERPKKARIGGTLRNQNPTLRELYQDLGGYQVGVIDRTEALKVAGNDELISVYDGQQPKERIVFMERVIDCQRFLGTIA